ncbi:cation transport ATPase [Candidatus Scalindua japonica]|uniref:Cation transport ATPase n=1 Tax=Candidatus Scalindua japonica TaxID=1284222 RepID=A0A286TUJ8_9BACT|nr:hemerythrin domain-containing protein [Candidatus Scalindua japonica]GAX59543.1 cation transport ATPase [Candidatus Scalindua japonica]
MSALIEKFKKEHSEIVAILKDVKKLGIHSEEGRSKLMSAKEYLLEHLREENEELYPVLRKNTKHNKNLKKDLEIFAIEPEYVSRVVLEFFDKYSEGTINKDFQINFESLFTALNARIRNEEEALYQEYEEIMKKMGGVS